MYNAGMRRTLLFARQGLRQGRSAAAKRRLASSSRSSQQGYQSIGSFQSENLADLMAASDAEYTPPSLPFQAETLEDDDSQSDDFLLDLDQWVFLNHGAFGGALRCGYNRAEHWRRYLERQPLRFFDRDLLPHLAYSTRRLADFMNAPCRENVTLLQNATVGLNSVIASYVREFGYSDSHHILHWDTTYGSVKKMSQHYCGSQNITEIPLQSQYLNRLAEEDEPEVVLEQAMLKSIDEANLYDKTPLLILDHTSSNTALTFPVERLAFKMKQVVPGAVVLVDGTHGLLAQKVDLSAMPSVDFYLSSGHKFLSAPRGVAVMALQQHQQENTGSYRNDANWKKNIRPAVISHGVDEKDLLSRFVWDGTRDYGAALALPVVLDHWIRANPEKIRQKLKEQLRQGIQRLAQYWHPDAAEITSWPGVVTLTHFDTSSMLSPMALVRLPDRFGNENTSTDAKCIQDYLYQNQIEVPIKCINGVLFVRVSCHVYNTTSDFEALGLAIQQIRL